MKLHETHSFLEYATRYIQFQLNKHGNYAGATTVEEAVNSLTPFELLTLVCEAIDDKETNHE